MITNKKAEEIVLGSIDIPEQKLLSAVCDLTDPKVVVEFGYFNGTSARTMLDNMDTDSHLYSYDIVKSAGLDDKRHTLIIKDMKEFDPKDIDNRKIDIVFFDASHKLEDNLQCFQKLADNLSPRALILVHDTGMYNKKMFNPDIEDKIVQGDMVLHRPEEVLFIDKLSEQGYSKINFTCMSKIRHGIAILQ